ncbi:MAG: copper ion binding protein [Acidimicrobiia bacterium]|nr:copper ion binding protein [Acidimicrobiia bacterium]
MTTLTLNVPDISCGHCKMSIEGAVSGLTGIGKVEVNIDPRTVDLEFDDAQVALDTIVAAIEEQGYEVAR